MTRDRGWLAAEVDDLIPCPRQGGVVDLERCLGCNWLLDLDRAGGAPAVRCAAVDPVADGRRDRGDQRID